MLYSRSLQKISSHWQVIILTPGRILTKAVFLPSNIILNGQSHGKIVGYIDLTLENAKNPESLVWQKPKSPDFW